MPALCTHPEPQVAPLLGHFATPWCNALRNIRDDLEKEQAFRGLLSVVQRSPESAVEAFTALAGVCLWGGWGVRVWG